jgi:hypothetical protein
VVGLIHVVLPSASLTRNLLIPCEPFTILILPVTLRLPTTSSLAPGVEVQIPTLPVASTLILWFPSPSAMIILFERFDARPVTLAPIIVLAEPVIIPSAVLYPIAVLLLPFTLLDSANVPSAVF